jgi:hypothetical protein
LYKVAAAIHRKKVNKGVEDSIFSFFLHKKIKGVVRQVVAAGMNRKRKNFLSFSFGGLFFFFFWWGRLL